MVVPSDTYDFVSLAGPRTYNFTNTTSYVPVDFPVSITYPVKHTNWQPATSLSPVCSCQTYQLTTYKFTVTSLLLSIYWCANRSHSNIRIDIFHTQWILSPLQTTLSNSVKSVMFGLPQSISLMAMSLLLVRQKYSLVSNGIKAEWSRKSEPTSQQLRVWRAFWPSFFEVRFSRQGWKRLKEKSW